MQRIHLHKPQWIHGHKLDWHLLGTRMEHLIHDPRFWAGLALGILFILMILTVIFAKPIEGRPSPFVPTYPPYMP